MGSSQQHSLLAFGASGTPQQKVVHVLVNRLKNKVCGFKCVRCAKLLSGFSAAMFLRRVT